MKKESKARLRALRMAIRKATTKSGADRLRAEYRIGQTMLRIAPGRSGYGDGTVRECAKHVGVRIERLYHYREFAAGYTRTQLTQLLEAAPNATFSHVVALMSAPPENRRRFETELGEKRLTVEELRTEIQERLKRRGNGGRNVALASSNQAAYRRLVVDLSRLTKRWECRKGQIKMYLNRGLPESFKKVRRAFQNAAREINALRKRPKRRQTRRKSNRGSK